MRSYFIDGRRKGAKSGSSQSCNTLAIGLPQPSTITCRPARGVASTSTFPHSMSLCIAFLLLVSGQSRYAPQFRLFSEKRGRFAVHSPLTGDYFWTLTKAIASSRVLNVATILRPIFVSETQYL